MSGPTAPSRLPAGGWWPPIVSATLALVAMGPVVFNDFTTWDDGQTLVNNFRINPPSWQGLWLHWTEPYMSLWVPLLYTVWAGLAAVSHAATGGLSPALFHGASVVIHALSSAGVAVIARLLLTHRPNTRANTAASRRDAETDAESAGGASADTAPTNAIAPTNTASANTASVNMAPVDIGAAAAGVVFAVHPVQLESVAWASGMKDLLYAFLCIAALVAALRGVASLEADRVATGAGDNGRSSAAGLLGNLMVNRMVWAATACYLAAMLVKPTAVVMPLMLLAVVTLGMRVRRAEVWMWAALWLVMAVPCAVWTKMVQPASEVPSVPLYLRPLVAGDALAFYMGKLVWPWPLVVDYGRTPPAVWESGALWWTWLVPAAVAAGLWAMRRRWRVGMVGALMAVIPLLPVLGLVKFDFQFYSTVADHYLYLPMLGVALAAGSALTWAAASLERATPAQGLMPARGLTPAPGSTPVPVSTLPPGSKPRSSMTLAVRSIGIGAAGAVIVAWVAVDWTMASRWRDTQSLFEHVLAHNPRSVAANNTLSALAVAQGDGARAERYARRAIELSGGDASGPDPRVGEAGKRDPLPWLSLASALALQGDRQGAASAYAEALEISPGHPEALSSLGGLAAEQGRLAEAEQFMRAAVDNDPYSHNARLNLGTLLTATTHLDAQRLEEGQVHLRAALRLRPSDTRTRINLAINLRLGGQRDEATQLVRSVLQQHPDDPRALSELRQLQATTR